MEFSEPDGQMVYRDGRGLRSVPIILLIMKFILFFVLVPWVLTARGCFVPNIPPDDFIRWDARGFHKQNGYWSLSVGGTRAGMHALAWVWNMRRHPDAGMSPRSRDEGMVTFQIRA